MSVISRYDIIIKDHINNLKTLPLLNFWRLEYINFKINEITATWDDSRWAYTAKDGRYEYYYFVDTQKVAQTKPTKTYDKKLILPKAKRELLMAYAIHLSQENLSIVHKVAIHLAARQWLSNMITDELNFAQNDLEIYFRTLTPSNSDNLRCFYNWLIDKGFVSKRLKIPKTKASNDKYDTDKLKISKVPDNKIITALGAITYDVFPSDINKWKTSVLVNQREIFVCIMSILAISSPNRVASEQPALYKQKLKFITKQGDDGECEASEAIVDEKSYYVNWRGSKGTADYKNHILQPMALPVRRALEYLNIVCEPARVLARFYENPKNSLSSILSDFIPSAERLKKINAKMDKPTHIIQLGYLLGYYPENETITVPPCDIGGNGFHKRYMKVNRQHIFDLRDNHKISLTAESLNKLLGISPDIVAARAIFGTTKQKRSISVGEFQSKWISFHLKQLGSFPVGFTTGENSIQFSLALFCFTGNQLIPITKAGKHRAKGGKKMSSSFFYLVSPLSMAHIYKNELNSPRSGNSIFNRYGFSSEFKINPHQLRHWLNDLLDRAGVPHQIINLISGRKSPEHLLHYLWQTDSERVSKIHDIQFNADNTDSEEAEDQEYKNIVVRSQKEFEKLSSIQDITSLTSTGFCVQNLIFNPCDYLNDFDTQCSLCSSSCHVKGDSKAIELMEQDLLVQKKRLEIIKKSSELSFKKTMQRWFKFHFNNTAILSELIKLMKDDKIRKGSVIRVYTNKNEIRITDLIEKKVIKAILCLPDVNKALALAVQKHDKNSGSDLDHALSLI